MVDRETGHGQPGIDPERRPGKAGRRRHFLVALFGAFGLEELHPPDPQDRQQRDACDDEPDPTQPLQDGAPQEDAARGGIQPGHHRRPGGGDPRHRFEEGVHRGHLPEPQRDRAHGRAGDPDRAGDKEGVHAPEAARPVRDGERGQPADETHQRRRLQENPACFGICQPDQRHQRRHAHHEQAIRQHDQRHVPQCLRPSSTGASARTSAGSPRTMRRVCGKVQTCRRRTHPTGVGRTLP